MRLWQMAVRKRQPMASRPTNSQKVQPREVLASKPVPNGKGRLPVAVGGEGGDGGAGGLREAMDGER